MSAGQPLVITVTYPTATGGYGHFGCQFWKKGQTNVAEGYLASYEMFGPDLNEQYCAANVPASRLQEYLAGPPYFTRYAWLQTTQEGLDFTEAAFPPTGVVPYPQYNMFSNNCIRRTMNILNYAMFKTRILTNRFQFLQFVPKIYITNQSLVPPPQLQESVDFIRNVYNGPDGPPKDYLNYWMAQPIPAIPFYTPALLRLQLQPWTTPIP